MNNPFYICRSLHFLLFETREEAMLRINSPTANYATNAAYAQDYATDLSQELDINIQCTQPENIYWILKKEGTLWKVINGEKIGWIIVVVAENFKPLAAENEK
jgi:hypothetical protein